MLICDSSYYYLYLPATFIYHDTRELKWLPEIDKKYNVTGGKLYQANIAKNNNLPSIEISTRELEVMVLLKDGKSSKEISSKLKLTLFTIESYRKALMKKTHCKNVADIVSLAYRTGLVPI